MSGGKILVAPNWSDEMRLRRRKSRWNGISLRDSFVLEEAIASGGFSTIVRAMDLDKKNHVAIKIGLAQDGSDHSDIILKESNILMHLHHNNIVSILPIPRSDKASIYCARARAIVREPSFFVMEYLQGGTLVNYLTHIGLLTPEETAAITLPITRAVEYLHKSDYAHNDLKLENIVFREPVLARNPFTPVLVDFGVVTKILMPPGQTMYITPPERIGSAETEKVSKGGSKIDYKKVDVWGIGIVLYRMLGGRLPFQGRNKKRLTDSICYERPESLQRLSSHVSPEWDQFVIDGCLAKKPQDRLSISDLIAWLRPYGRGVVAATSGNSQRSGLFGRSRS